VRFTTASSSESCQYELRTSLVVRSRGCRAFPPRRMAPLNIWEQFPGIDAIVEQLLRRVMSARTAGACETYYEPTERWLAINTYPFRDGTSVLFDDISERKSGQRERERLIQELQDAPCGHPDPARADSDLCLVQENPRLLRAVRAVPERALASEVYAWHVPGLPGEVHPNLNLPADGTNVTASGPARCPFRVVKQEANREIGWVNRFLDRERIRRVADATQRSYAHHLLYFLRWWPATNVLILRYAVLRRR
jgi:hypothetical protein